MDIRTVTLPSQGKKNTMVQFQVVRTEDMTSQEVHDIIFAGWKHYSRRDWREWEDEDEYPTEAEAARRCGVKDGEKFAVKFEYVK